MPKCMPIDTNQYNPTKIIEGCQEIIKILTDKKSAVAQHAAMQYGWNWERESGIPSMCHFVARGIYIRWQHLISIIYIHSSAV